MTCVAYVNNCVCVCVCVIKYMAQSCQYRPQPHDNKENILPNLSYSKTYFYAESSFCL